MLEPKQSYFRPLVLGALLLLNSTFANAKIGNDYSKPWKTPRAENFFISLSSASYISDTVANAQSVADSKTGHVFASVGGRLATDAESTWQGVAEGEFGLSAKQPKNYFINVPEVYLGVRPGDGTLQVSVGRKLETWNYMDEFWAMGLHQPRFMWDHFDTRQNGMTGVFASFNTEWIQATGFASPIFVPDQGTPFDLSDGQCTSPSPWFTCPSATITLFNQPTTVYYKLDMPDKLKFINRPGYAGLLRVGKQEGIFAKATYAEKAMNQIFLAYEGFLNLATQSLPATIHPRSYRHELITGEAGYTAERWALVGSMIDETPVRDNTPSNWTTQEESDVRYYGVTIYTKLFGEGDGVTSVDFGYLHRDGGNPGDKGPFANPNQPVFEPRHDFWQAYNVVVRTPIVPDWGKYFWLSGRFVVDRAYNGSILVADVNVRPFPSLTLNAGVDLLGSEIAGRTDFISRWQRNDRIRGGIRYVF